MDTVAERLGERNAQIGQANELPRVFVISSTEGKQAARLVRQNLDGEAIHVHLWDQGTFSVSDYPMSSLENVIEAADFAIAVVRADDVLVSRDGKEVNVARGNVHLEYGMAVDWGAEAIKVDGPQILEILQKCYGDLDQHSPNSEVGMLAQPSFPVPYSS